MTPTSPKVQPWPTEQLEPLVKLADTRLTPMQRTARVRQAVNPYHADRRLWALSTVSFFALRPPLV